MTTGGSVKEVIELLRAQGVNVVGVGAVVDRSDGTVEFQGDSQIPFYAFATLNVESWEPGACSLCHQGLPITKPGSRMERSPARSAP